MSYVIGKRMTAYPPRFAPEAGPQPYFSGGLMTAGSVMTAVAGAWHGQGSSNLTCRWLIDGSLAYASASRMSYSISAADAGKGLTAHMSMGNATWGTNYAVLHYKAGGTISA